MSDAPHQEYTVAGFADDLASLCGELRLQRPTVGCCRQWAMSHSMSWHRHSEITLRITMRRWLRADANCRWPILRRLANLPTSILTLCPQLVVAQTLGAGHFSPLEVPDQVNAMIDRFCAIVTNNHKGAGELA